MTRVLIALTSHSDLGDTGRKTGFYVSEAAEPWTVFTEAGYEVGLVSVAGGRPPIDGLDENDPIQQKFLAAVDLDHTPVAAELDATTYDAIFFAGGHGTMWDFPEADDLLKLAAQIYEDGGVVAAVCHGPSALVNLKLADGKYLVDGKNVAGFTNAEEEAVGLTDVVPFLLADELTKRGAIHHPADNFAVQAVADGRLVTGQNPQSAQLTAEKTVEALAG
ncbi:type 1 glutamine amidotransferase domain-containing protein [Kribbella albertanoniae]|uniref:Type 1 glutamine amidotransferase domain-containing protein n=1 Tax=Kribbella albertanoniae TaxID=1266829 RepID=A0A4R4PCJ4_9ACTN|nr:type 1 glutamine amidotransferase domain-containing protein [Kribbella albertanoniae]TDC18860.1 type 1 glutamine amidotransferase domain-containing protein [Kribbella albertanoniae]